MEDRSALRAALVDEARSWLGTPYVFQAGVKGAGVDCAFLILRVYQAVGLVPADVDPRPYNRHWHLHVNDHRYEAWVARFLAPLPLPPARTPAPGDVLLFRFGRAAAHSALVVGWPFAVHVESAGRGAVEEIDATRGALHRRLVQVWGLDG